MAVLAEVLQYLAYALFLFVTIFYTNYLDKIKKRRKLTPSELTIYIMALTGMTFIAISVIITRFFS